MEKIQGPRFANAVEDFKRLGLGRFYSLYPVGIIRRGIFFTAMTPNFNN